MLDLRRFKPCFLIAMPQMEDPHFQQAVVLLAEYNEEGAYGLVVNRRIEKTLKDVERPEAPVDHRLHPHPVWYGGPISLDSAMVIFETVSDDLLVDLGDRVSALGQGLFITGNTMALTTHADHLLKAPFKVVAGHAGWGIAQLDEEIAHSSWLVAPLDKSLLFSQPEKMWDCAVRSLGIEPNQLAVADSELAN